MAVNDRKAAIAGLGFVGSASAFALMQSGLFSELVLVNRDTGKAEGEALDISHGLPFARPMKIYAGTYDDIVDAAVIACPKQREHDCAEKLTAIFRANDVRAITLCRMFVPCCGGLEYAVYQALAACGKAIPLRIVILGADGKILKEEQQQGRLPELSTPGVLFSSFPPGTILSHANCPATPEDC